MLYAARLLLLPLALGALVGPRLPFSLPPISPPTMLQVTPNLMVQDVAQTVAFYQQHLGFRVLTTVPEQALFSFALVQAGGVQLMFQEAQSLKAEYPVLNTKQPGPGLTLYVRVKDVQALYEQVKGHVTVLKTPHKMFYGTTEFAIQDNNGFVLTFSGE